MAIDERLLKSVIAEVLKEMNTADTSAAAAEESCSEGMTITEVGDAQKGTNPNEVVLGVSSCFWRFPDKEYRRYSSRSYHQRDHGWS